MPTAIHCLYDATNDEVATFTTARRKEHMEIMLAILSSVEIVIYTVWKRLEALCADKTVHVVFLISSLNNFFVHLKSLMAVETKIIPDIESGELIRW